MLNTCQILCLQIFWQLKKQIGIWCETKWVEEIIPVFIEEDSPSEKVVIVEEELDGIDTDCFGNLRIYLE